jgi:hypothetical protein
MDIRLASWFPAVWLGALGALCGESVHVTSGLTKAHRLGTPRRSLREFGSVTES